MCTYDGLRGGNKSMSEHSRKDSMTSKNLGDMVTKSQKSSHSWGKFKFFGKYPRGVLCYIINFFMYYFSEKFRS